MRLVIKPNVLSMDAILDMKEDFRKSCLTAASKRQVLHERQISNPKFDLTGYKPSRAFLYHGLYSLFYDVLAVVDAEYFLKYGMFPGSVVVTSLKSKTFRKEVVESIRRFKALPSSMGDSDIVKEERHRIMEFASNKYNPEDDSYDDPLWWSGKSKPNKTFDQP